jgi:hypothetical protein
MASNATSIRRQFGLRHAAQALRQREPRSDRLGLPRFGAGERGLDLVAPVFGRGPGQEFDLLAIPFQGLPILALPGGKFPGRGFGLLVPLAELALQIPLDAGDLGVTVFAACHGVPCLTKVAGGVGLEHRPADQQ